MLNEHAPHPLRHCQRCLHWHKSTSKPHADGYIENMCIEPRDNRDWKYTRGSDSCGKWTIKP